ncbi:acyltransferase family protein [Alphaproteobacteria bacterium]|nr:acyltransferase family protein [Alphaproteobacteria bacterium]
MGMPLFFVLSGFVIHYNYGSSFLNKAPWTASYDFFVARIARLYPLLAFTLLFALWHDDWYLHVWQKFNIEKNLALSYLFNVFSWYPVWADKKLLIQHTFGIAWSVSTEWFFYCTYIFFAAAVSRIQFNSALISIAVICGASYAFQLFGVMNPTAIVGLFFDISDNQVDFGNSAYRWFYYVSPYS